MSEQPAEPQRRPAGRPRPARQPRRSKPLRPGEVGVRALVAGFGAMLSALGAMLLLRAGRPATVDAAAAALVLPTALVGAFDAVIWAFRPMPSPFVPPVGHPEAGPGTDGDGDASVATRDGGPDIRGRLLGLLALAVAAGLVAAATVGHRTIGWSAVPGGPAGLVLVVAGTVALAIALRR